MNEGINRREFLVLAGASAGVFCVGSFLNSSINLFDSKNTIDASLDKEFGPIKDDFSFSGSNFGYFTKILRRIDSNIRLRRGNNLSFANKTLTLPHNFKYKDIPSFITFIKNNIGGEVIEDMFERTKNSYRDRAYYLLKASKNSKNNDAYIQSAFKLFTISCLYSGVSNEKEIRNSFEKLLNLKIENKEAEREVEEMSISFETKLKLEKTGKNKFIIPQEKLEKLYNLAITQKDKFIDEYLLLVNKYIDNLPIDNKNVVARVVRNLVITSVKVNSILIKFSKDLVDEVHIKVQDYFFSINKPVSPEQYLSEKVEKNIQISLKDDFEKGLYTAMIDDMHPRLKKNILRLTSDAVSILSFKESFVQNEINSVVLNNYLRSDLDDYSFEKYGEKYQEEHDKGNNIGIEELLTSKQKDDLSKLRNKILEVYSSKEFKEILLLCNNNKFGKVKDVLRGLAPEDKIAHLYLLFSFISKNLFYNILTPETQKTKVKIDEQSKNESVLNNSYVRAKVFSEEDREVRYDKNAFELDRLDLEKSSYSCMSIAAFMNYLIEDIFGFEGKGVVVFRHGGTVMDHIGNGIEFGDYLLYIDTTNAIINIVDKTKYSNDFYYEVDDFANTYLRSAIENVGLYMRDEYFTEDEREYIKGYLNMGSENTPLAKADREKAISWRIIKEKNLEQ